LAVIDIARRGRRHRRRRRRRRTYHTYITTYNSKSYSLIFKCKHVLKIRECLLVFKKYKYHMNLITNIS